MSALVSKTPLRQVSTVKEMLANKLAADQLASVAAAHMNPERMMRVLALAVSKTPKLAECSPLSILGALMQSASLGLEPNTVMGHSYLVPFDRYERAKNKGDKPRKVGTEVQLIVGYRGFVQLGWNSSMVRMFDAAIHYESDPVWKWSRGSTPKLDHETGDETGAILHAYAIFESSAGGKTWVVWPEAKLAAHRDRYSKGYAADVKYGKKPTDANVNIWLSDPDLARRKTMIRQLAKVMPLATDAPRAAAYDGARADYATFAMEGSSMGNALIEHQEDEDGATEHDDDGVVLDEKPAAEAAPRQDEATPGPDGKAALAAAQEKAKAAAAKAKEPAPAETKPAEPDPAADEPAWVDAFRQELYGWGKSDTAINDFLEMYAGFLDPIKGTPLHAKLLAEVEAHAASDDEAEE